MNSYPLADPGVIGYRDKRAGMNIEINIHLPALQKTRISTHQYLDLLALCNGNNRIDDIAHALDTSQEKIKAMIYSANEKAPGTFRSKYISDEEKKKAKIRALGDQMFRQWKATQGEPADNRKYHSDGIANAMYQFDIVETTVSHAFRKKHEALGNRNYGETFCDKLLDDGILKSGCKVLEIGCGTGFFAKSLLNRLQVKKPQLYESIHYSLFDLSPELQKFQKKQCSEHDSIVTFISGDIAIFDFKDKRFDLIICNEMIADLGIGTAKIENLNNHVIETAAEELILKYHLDYTPNYQSKDQIVTVNTHAAFFIEKISKLLSKKGHAVIVEYGSLNTFPQAVILHDHTEYSIHFGHLRQVSESLGFKTRIESLVDYLGFNGNCMVLNKQSWHAISNYLLPFLEKPPLQRLIYTEKMLIEKVCGLYDNIVNVKFQPLSEDNFITPFGFQVLVLSSETI